MFDFLRNLTKSAEVKRQETVAAYLDGALSDRARLRFEQEMAEDSALRQQVEQLRLVQQSLRQLPQRQVPRNFLLDPAKYGRPARQPWVQAYPVLRTATALAAFFFIFAVVAGSFTNFGLSESALAPAADVAQFEADEEAVEETRVVTEQTESLAMETAAEDVAIEEDIGDSATVMEAEPEALEEVAEDEAMAEEATEEEAVEEAATQSAEEVPPAEATAAAQSTDSLQGDSAEDGELPAETAPAPTPTVSTLPRVTPPTPLPDRDPDLADADDTANSTAADALEEEGEDTAVSPEPTTSGPTVNPLPWLQIGLGLLLLLLAGLTFYARRQR